ncbi:MAG TPA: CPBP family glutamic-type intramembrane protease [Herpetosiphonaceae bacterium]
MKTTRAFITRHPVLSYYALTFVISWGGILIVIAPSPFPPTNEHVTRLLPLVLGALFAGPSIASLVLTGLVAGRAGYRDLFARMMRWRVDVRWYTVALCFAPFLVSGLLLALSLASPAFLPRILTTNGKTALLLFGIGWGLVGGGLLEELGWTGFAIPRLLERHSVLATGLIVGFLWGVWHYLIAFWVISGTNAGSLSPAIFLPALIFYAGSLSAYRVLMVWVYDRNGGSLLVAMLMHASLSASSLIFEPLDFAVVPAVTYNLLLAAALWAVVGAVAVANHGHLSRPSLRTRAA